MSERFFFAPMVIVPWKDVELSGIFAQFVPFGGDGKSFGYIPVYETLLALKRDYPDAPVMKVKDTSNSKSQHVAE